MANELTEGTEGKTGIPRKSIASKERIPNVAIFLRRTTLEFLQILFSQRAEGSFKYDADESKTEIQIMDQNAVDLEAIHTRPAIIGTRGPVSWAKMGLGGGSMQELHRPTGDATYTDMLTGSVAFSIISREGIEAEQIAHIVFNSFKFFRPVLQKYGFFSIKSLNLGASNLVVQEGENDDLHLIPVYVQADIQDRWSLKDNDAKKLKKIVVDQIFKPDC